MIDVLKYRGKVNSVIKRNNTVVSRSTHNTGLPDMSLLFAKAVSGTLDATTDIPRLLDIGYIVPQTIYQAENVDNKVWQSVLNVPCSITGRQFKYDTALNNWVGILTTTVLSSDLNGPLLDNVLNESGDREFKIRLCSYSQKNRHYFAEINIDDVFLKTLRESTSAIVTWYCELLYDNQSVPEFVNGIIGE